MGSATAKAASQNPDHPSRKSVRDEHERQLHVVTTTLELALHGHSNPTRHGDPEALANEAYNRIRKLEKVKTALLELVAELR